MGKPFKRLMRKRYQSTELGYQKYLHFMNKPVGVIKDNIAADIMGGKFDDATMSQSQYDPGQLFDALAVYDRASTFNPDRRILSVVYNRVKQRFGALDKSLVPLDYVEVVHYIARDASSGAPLFKKKGDVLDSNHKLEFKGLCTDPCVAYYRTQSRQKTDGTFSPKVRLVWGFPLDQTLLEGKYARSAIEAIMASKSPYALGLLKTQISARMSAFKWAPLVGSFDWSKFDATVPAQLISLAFQIVKGWFAPGTINETEWSAITRYFINTPILMPDGRVYSGKTCGIPSGSYFTGIIGSLCNLLLIEYLLHEQNVKLKEILVMGDDSIVALPHEVDVVQMARSARAAFGMELHPDKQRYTRYDHDLEFLSHTWKTGRACRPVQVSRAKAVYSERGWARNANVEQMRALRLVSLYADNPDFWPHVREWFRRKGAVQVNGTRTGLTLLNSFTDKTTEVFGRKQVIVPLALATFR